MRYCFLDLEGYSRDPSFNQNKVKDLRKQNIFTGFDYSRKAVSARIKALDSGFLSLSETLVNVTTQIKVIAVKTNQPDAS